ncbi:hypothetical protein [Geoalkalibacter subterraneus]|uniref:Uncharacterized protein n=1 Tax=Geoalkalibacter subterraneus TaxID=483547 RepID=A0A0B5FXH3_9BACT|nr:hypothetical protein [Geoalkalibacter subterraneus]AJF08291.1 hypothetical protein GSUB_17600 [Geoalkalibacter subterraneus]
MYIKKIDKKFKTRYIEQKNGGKTMAKERVQVSFHFNIDPAEMMIGQISLPETIMKTVAVGESEPVVSKVNSSELSDQDRAKLIDMIEQRVIKAGKKAKSVKSSADAFASPAPSKNNSGTSTEEKTQPSSEPTLDLF